MYFVHESNLGSDREQLGIKKGITREIQTNVPHRRVLVLNDRLLGDQSINNNFKPAKNSKPNVICRKSTGSMRRERMIPSQIPKPYRGKL